MCIQPEFVVWKKKIHDKNIYVCIYICVCIYIHTHAYICVCIHVCVCIYICIYVDVYHMCMKFRLFTINDLYQETCAEKNKRMYIYIYTYIQIHMRVYIHVRVCMSVCIHIYIYYIYVKARIVTMQYMYKKTHAETKSLCPKKKDEF